jgi:hypothetical protein
LTSYGVGGQAGPLNLYLLEIPDYARRSIYIFLLSSALRINVEKNLIISTKLFAGMSARLISTCNPISEEGSEHTLVDGMDPVRQCATVSPILVVVPDDVAREVPIVPRICGPRPYCQHCFDGRLSEYTHLYFRT